MIAGSAIGTATEARAPTVPHAREPAALTGNKS